MAAAARGSAAVDEKALRRNIKSVTTGKKDLTDAQMVDLLLRFLPHTYSSLSRELLTESVAKITPLSCGRGVAADEPAPVTKKRQTQPATAAAERGSAAVGEEALRRNIVGVTAGEKGLTDAQIVDLLLRFVPQTYSSLNRELLTECVAKITPLPCRREVAAVDEPAPVTKKRQKITPPPSRIAVATQPATTAAERGSAAVADEALRWNIQGVTAGKKDLTDAQMVDLLLCFLPQTYSSLSRELLIERVAKITPLSCRRAVAVDEPAPVTKKRQKITPPPSRIAVATGEPARKIDEAPILNRRNVVSSSAVSGEPSDCDYSCDPELMLDFSDVIPELFVPNSGLGDGRREMDKTNGEGGRRDVNWSNQENLGNLGQSGSDGGREKHNQPMFIDFHGRDEVLHDLRRELVTPLLHWKLLRHLGVEPTARILLHGPPRCGKTRLARAIANEAKLAFFEFSAARLVSRDSEPCRGAAEKNIRELFSTACMRAPSVVFIDELDAMTSKTGRLRKEIDPRIVNQLMVCMDERCGLINNNAGSESCDSRPGYVLVIGATNNPDALDPALRRRFDREFALGVPGFNERYDILSDLSQYLKYEDESESLDLPKLALSTMGYLEGDLVALAKNAGIIALNRIVCKRGFYEGLIGNYSMHPFHNAELRHLRITMADYVEAGKMVQPSAKMEGFSTIPKAKWDDVGGLQPLKLDFECRIVKNIKYPEVYTDLGVDLATSFFLCGPSGCGKTLIVEALAKEAGATFMHIRAHELLKFGELTELVMHNIFSYASTHLPCVLFFDALDVMTPSPCDDGERWPDFRKLMSELTETEVRMGGVFVIAATNRPEFVNYFSLINTQFDRIVYIPLPSPGERGAILKALARRKPVDANVDLMALGKDAVCENFSGADLSALMKEASKFAIDRPSLSDEGHMTIKDVDFKRALAKISPSLSSAEVKNWELQAKKIVVLSSSVMDW